jgi:Ca2+-binding EF-hand superfamily protein
MNRVLLTLALFLGIFFVDGSAVAPPLPSDQDACELIYLGKDRPYRLRLLLRTKTGSYRDSWNAQMDRLFAWLDANKDGRLSPNELSHAPSREQFVQMTTGDGQIAAYPGPKPSEMNGDAKGVTLVEFRKWYSSSISGPLRVAWSSRGQAEEPHGASLLRNLKLDREKNLSRGQLRNLWPELRKLDENEDECLDNGEILGTPRLFGPTFITSIPGEVTGLAALDMPFAVWRVEDDPAMLVQALSKRYGSRADRFLKSKPDVEIRIPVDDPDAALTVTRAGTGDFRAVSNSSTLTSPAGLMDVSRRVASQSERRRAFAVNEQTFAALDRNKDGYLDSAEVFLPPFEYVAWLRIADRDGDEKVSRQEFLDFLKLQASLVENVTILRIVDEGQSFFRLLDADGDGRLSPREMRQAEQRLEPVLGKADSVQVKQLPRQVRIQLIQGRLNENGATERVADGPVWFQKMDRNRDGDVSHAEWLGSEARFAELDKDGDGLLSAAEARAGDARWR